MGNKPASGGGGSSATVDRKGSKLSSKRSTLGKSPEVQHIVKSPKNYVDMGIVEEDEQEAG